LGIRKAGEIRKEGRLEILVYWEEEGMARFRKREG
jgi:hypothetical protein